MRTISFHKNTEAICNICHKNPVPLGKALRPCKECLAKEKTTTEGSEVIIGTRQPAAVIDANGKKVFVDKFGKEVEGHGYDLTNDPRGYNKTKTSKKTRQVV